MKLMASTVIERARLEKKTLLLHGCGREAEKVFLENIIALKKELSSRGGGEVKYGPSRTVRMGTQDIRTIGGAWHPKARHARRHRKYIVAAKDFKETGPRLNRIKIGDH